MEKRWSTNATSTVEEWWSSNSAGALEVTYFRSAA